MTARILLRGQLRHLRDAGFRVALACAPGPDLDATTEREGVEVFPVPFEREIRPLRDLAALLRMLRVCRRFRPHAVSAGTPKAGLLGMLAARLAGVPVRIYTLRGLRLEGTTGMRRRLLAAAERRAAASAHLVVCVSESLRRRYVQLGLASEARTQVLADGSSNGVDVQRFHPDRRGAGEVLELRRGLGLPAAAPVIGFVGRFTRDKGLVDLEEAFTRFVAPRLPEARLLLIGRYEAGDPVPHTVRRRLGDHPAVVEAGFLDDVAPAYALMDILALPAYREGLPNAALEAAASGLPVAGYRVTGTVDAVEDGRTGTLVAPGDVESLGRALLAYLESPELRRAHGAAGRERAVARFAQERIWGAWADLYRELLKEQGIEAAP